MIVCVLLNPPERVIGDRHVEVDRRPEGVEPGVRAPERLLHVDELDAVARAHQVASDRRRRRPACPLERTAHHAGVSEVIAHQTFDALLRLGSRIPEHVRRLFLHLMTEDVEIAPSLEVQDRPEPQEEILGLVEIALGSAGVQHRRVGDPRDRGYRGKITKRARRVLHVGLELIERVVEPRVPLVDQVPQRIVEIGMRLPPAEQRREAIEQRALAGDGPGITERDDEFRIVDLEPRAVGELTHLVADDEAEIPQRVEEPADKPLIVGPNRAVEHHEHVEIRVETRCRRPYPPSARMATGRAARGASAYRRWSSVSTRPA